MKFGSKMSKHGTFHNIGTPVRPIRFCSKICYVGGRLIAAPTRSVPPNYCSKTCHVGGRLIAVMLLSDRPRRSLDFDSLRGAPPYTVYATKSPSGNFGALWGRILSARLFPHGGNNVGAMRRQCSIEHDTARFGSLVQPQRGSPAGLPHSCIQS